MKKLFAALLLLPIMGCSAYVDGWKVNKAVLLCTANNGVDYVDVVVDVVRCNNGAVRKLDLQVLE